MLIQLSHLRPQNLPTLTLTTSLLFFPTAHLPGPKAASNNTAAGERIAAWLFLGVPARNESFPRWLLLNGS
ncbi:ATPase family associated with various cellular activities (AAA) [Musa troglodytarum]|uniref:ATPase family associated with various cellular activities (AAA) n=1 Tax=Musa troglodytarum TaxID=320322 RepID=A0A9E7HUJ1_9LILI|nr:ATPase family associated with various cellular activities (AAA) [Musa troglodytarum]